ncbi:hypothetical protein G6F40_013664 [Rhizopus arrhizus]|nr:hypothetical protein G6F40_013664 [Rhizopus arrhizus]
MEQALQGRRRTIYGHRQLLAHHRHGHVHLGHAAQHVRHQVASFERVGVAPVGGFIVGSAVDVVEDGAGQPLARHAAKVVEVLALVQTHRKTLINAARGHAFRFALPRRQGVKRTPALSVQGRGRRRAGTAAAMPLPSYRQMTRRISPDSLPQTSRRTARHALPSAGPGRVQPALQPGGYRPSTNVASPRPRMPPAAWRGEPRPGCRRAAPLAHKAAPIPALEPAPGAVGGAAIAATNAGMPCWRNRPESRRGG